MRLALFDLDHTLIPHDSGMAWLRFLIGRGHLPEHTEPDYLGACQRYVDGLADVHALHHALLWPLREVSRSSLNDWLAEFDAQLAAHVPEPSRALVARHREAGDRCVLVTATTRFIAERYAKAFGIDEVLASEALADSHGQLTGRIAGLPCIGPHKLAKLQGWLQLESLSLADFDSSHFYSDAASDLPLLEAVSHPVAVRPDATLRAIAQARGWPVETF
jgi:HAD superfamily hydrolase (TIGR01490 family)